MYKGRAEVNGSNAKPFKQKEPVEHAVEIKISSFTRRRRYIWSKPRDFSFVLPKKVKRLAMKSILSLKAQTDRLTIIEDFTIESGKTKDLVSILKNFVKDEHRTVVVLKDNDAMLKRAGKNIPTVSFLSYNRLRAHDLFYGQKIIMLESAVKNLSDFYVEEQEAK